MVVSAGRRVSIELCGELRLEVDGRRRERELPGRLGRILLGYLALNRHRAVTRDELIDALWPAGPPDDPSRTLSTLLSGLRRSLGAELLRGRSEVRLVLPEGAQLDAERAAADVARGAQALASGDPASAAAAAEGALDTLERGLLHGFEAPCLDARRRVLEQERLDALELLARAALAGEDLRRSQWASRQAVALAPYRETGYALLMEAQEAHGNLAEALKTYERLRTLMRDELGAAPSPQLRAAHRRLRSRRATRRTAARGSRSPSPSRWPASRASDSSAATRRWPCSADASPRPPPASGGSCSSGANPASARVGWRRRSRGRPTIAATPSSSMAAPTRTRSRRTSPSWRCSRTASPTGRSRSSPRSSGPSSRRSPGSCRPRGAGSPLRAAGRPVSPTSSATGCSRRWSPRCRRWPATAPPCWSATTCTGPTPPPSGCCGTSPGPPPPRGSSSWGPIETSRPRPARRSAT